MEIHPDAVALLFDGHSFELLVEAGIFDGDRGLSRERANRLLVVRGELVSVLLLGEIQVPERHPAEEDGSAKEAPHRWMIRRKPHRPRIVGDPPKPQRALVALKSAEDSPTLWERPDPRTLRIADPRSDEPLDVAVLVEDAERRVSRARDLASLIRDALKDGGGIEL